MAISGTYKKQLIQKALHQPNYADPVGYAQWKEVKKAARLDKWKNRIAKWGKRVFALAMGLSAITLLAIPGLNLAVAPSIGAYFAGTALIPTMAAAVPTAAATTVASVASGVAIGSTTVAGLGAIGAGYSAIKLGQSANLSNAKLKDGRELFRQATIEKRNAR